MVSMPDPGFSGCLVQGPLGSSSDCSASSRAALRSLSSATLAVGSAAAFLVLVTLLSFVPDGGAGDRTIAWQLRGSLPPSEVSSPSREQVAQRAAS